MNWSSRGVPGSGAVERMSLHELALYHGTDKAVPRRSLASLYDTLLADQRDLPVSLLEIGVFGGASLRMWRDYFPLGQIYGLDRDESARDHEGERISIIIGNQEDRSTLADVVAEARGFDIVVDDGGHRARQQVGTLIYLWTHLHKGGFYIIEDTHTSYLVDFNMRWRQPGTTIEFLKGVVDDVHAMWHEELVILPELTEIHFYNETCVLRKASSPTEGDHERHRPGMATGQRERFEGG
jgi:Methyltransferase domain